MLQKALPLLVALPAFASASQIPLSAYRCTHPPSKAHIFSLDPLVIYIADFVTDVERQHILSTSAASFSASLTSDDSGAEDLRSTRRSQSASAHRDAVVECIEQRAINLQGLDVPASHVEPIQLVKYGVNETYDFHTDWFTSPTQTTPAHGGNRVTSFFAYVHASDDITGGGTNFPMLEAPKEPESRWCEFIDCDVPFDEGVTFLPIPGNAVFWVNLGGGKGDQRVLHKGEVVTSGSKVGMNVWTRQGPIAEQIRAGS